MQALSDTECFRKKQSLSKPLENHRSVLYWYPQGSEEMFLFYFLFEKLSWEPIPFSKEKHSDSLPVFYTARWNGMHFVIAS